MNGLNDYKVVVDKHPWGWKEFRCLLPRKINGEWFWLKKAFKRQIDNRICDFTIFSVTLFYNKAQYKYGTLIDIMYQPRRDKPLDPESYYFKVGYDG